MKVIVHKKGQVGATDYFISWNDPCGIKRWKNRPLHMNVEEMANISEWQACTLLTHSMFQTSEFSAMPAGY